MRGTLLAAAAQQVRGSAVNKSNNGNTLWESSTYLDLFLMYLVWYDERSRQGYVHGGSYG